MTTELEKQFFDTFGIKCNINCHQQFNFGQVSRGLEFYKEREKLAETGMIKIWHKMLNSRPENDCVYWGEYHYPQITDRHYLELMCLLSGYCQTKHACNYQMYSTTMDCFKKEILEDFITHYETFDDFKECKHQVQAIFEG